jgi:hypothetical protein
MRYEDMVARPQEQLVPMLDFLGLDAGEVVLEKMLLPLQGRDLQSRRHITSNSKANSVGRWRQDPQADAWKLLTAHAKIIERLGYPVCVEE